MGKGTVGCEDLCVWVRDTVGVCKGTVGCVDQCVWGDKGQWVVRISVWVRDTGV